MTPYESVFRLKIQHPLKLQARYFLQRLSRNALEIAVHADGGLHDAVDLLIAFGHCLVMA